MSTDLPDLPVIVNSEIVPPQEGEDEKGWRKNSIWLMDATQAGVGDEAFGHAYGAQYVRAHPTNAGEWLVITETYYVEPDEVEDTTDEGNPVKRRHYNVLGQYEFLTCTDPESPGETEITSDYEYDNEIHPLFIWDYEEARAMAERQAREDQRYSLTWEG